MTRPQLLFGALASILLVASGSSCRRAPSGPKVAREDISLMPRETNFVLTFNVARTRGTPLWKRLVDFKDQPENKPKYDDFVQRTGLDPVSQLDSVFVGLPTGGPAGEFGAVLRGGPFDEAKISAYFKEEAAKSGNELVTAEYNGRKLYGDKQGEGFASFLDKKTLVVGGKEWIKKILDLAGKGGDSAAKNDALTAVVKKTKTGDSLWGAGLVPEEVRARLRDDPKLSAAATMKDVYASLDVKDGFTLAATLDLAGPAEAKELTARVSEQLADAKKNPQVLMMGMTQFIDAVKVSADGAAFHLDVKLTQPQVDDLVNRVQGLLKSFGNALGGAGGGAIEAPPPPPPPAPLVPVPPQ